MQGTAGARFALHKPRRLGNFVQLFSSLRPLSLAVMPLAPGQPRSDHRPAREPGQTPQSSARRLRPRFLEGKGAARPLTYPARHECWKPGARTSSIIRSGEYFKASSFASVRHERGTGSFPRVNGPAHATTPRATFGRWVMQAVLGLDATIHSRHFELTIPMRAIYRRVLA